MLYDRPVRDLMRDAAGDLPLPTSPAAVVDWFARKYPLVKKTTVTAHVKGLTSNDPNRHHYSVSRYEPVFTWTRDGRLASYDPDTDLGDQDDEEDDNEAAGQVPPDAAEFVLEAHLEEFLLGNWNAVSWGRPLKVWQGPGGAGGHQLVTPVGRLDILCVDTSTSALVVVELKRGRSADRVVGQVARYMGWARAHLAAAGQGVEGIVVAREHDDRLRYAAAAVPGLAILTYRVTFHLEPVPGIALLPGQFRTIAIAACALLCDAAAQSDDADTRTQEPPFGAVCGEWAVIRVGAQIGLIWFNRFPQRLSGPAVAC